jgi:hypothetical protein
VPPECPEILRCWMSSTRFPYSCRQLVPHRLVLSKQLSSQRGVSACVYVVPTGVSHPTQHASVVRSLACKLMHFSKRMDLTQSKDKIHEPRGAGCRFACCVLEQLPDLTWVQEAWPGLTGTYHHVWSCAEFNLVVSWAYEWLGRT